MTPEIKELILAAEDSLKHGEHDGPCDNAGLEHRYACSFHVEMGEARHARLERALLAIKQ